MHTEVVLRSCEPLKLRTNFVLNFGTSKRISEFINNAISLPVGLPNHYHSYYTHVWHFTTFCLRPCISHCLRSMTTPSEKHCVFIKIYRHTSIQSLKISTRQWKYPTFAVKTFVTNWLSQQRSKINEKLKMATVYHLLKCIGNESLKSYTTTFYITLIYCLLLEIFPL